MTIQKSFANKPTSEHKKTSFLSPATLSLTLGSLGIVYGDIGTSPLYALRECFRGTYAVVMNEGNILGIISLIFWSLTIVISLKYVLFFMRADYKGMGGIFALLALILTDAKKISPRLCSVLIFVAILGASLLFGDGVITPAISVLSAVEGLKIATEAAKPIVVPLTCLIIFFLFMVQHRGVRVIGNIFGPVMIVWFITIAILGIKEIMVSPDILRSINPIYAFDFFAANQLQGFLVLGAVVLCITGGEALYADMGHFGKKPIRISWFGLAFPSLLLNYFGQGALLLNDPSFAFNPFYGMVPKGLLYPMVLLSTVATIIASQAMIAGIFSLTHQAIDLGFIPKMQIIQTSQDTQGQIYIPQINYIMMVTCIGLVLLFRESSGLAGAYGIAVTANMGFTSVLYFFVITRVWGWQLSKAVPLLIVFLIFDVSFFIADLPKILDGGWITVLIATIVVTAMVIWNGDRKKSAGMMQQNPRSFAQNFIADVVKQNPQRIQGSAVFISTSILEIPNSFLHYFKLNRFLHEKIVFVFIRSVDFPDVTEHEKIKIKKLGHGFYQIIASHGSIEKPDIITIMNLASSMGLSTDPASTIYYMNKKSLAGIPGSLLYGFNYG